MFEFNYTPDDGRSIFVNKICKLIMKANEYDIDKSLVALEDIYELEST